jgi:hypothetical protein
MKHNTKWMAGAILVIALMASVSMGAMPAANDQTFAKIEGVVKDLETGKALTNVLVCVEGCKKSAMTNDSGKFFLDEVPVGTCCMKVSKRGYQVLQANIDVKDGTKNEFKVQLKAETKAEVKPTAGITQKS